MAGHAGFLRLLDEAKELHQKKAADYGSDSDPFANIRAAARRAGCSDWRAAWSRAGDKIQRIDRYCEKGTLANEGVDDSFRDLAAYALIALALFQEKQINDSWKDAPTGQNLGGHGPSPRGYVAPPAPECDAADPFRGILPKSDRPCVYIAGPISKGDLAHNINQATKAFFDLYRAGFAPWCPQWSCFSGGAALGALYASDRDPKPFAWATRKGGEPGTDWLAVDLPWVERADAVLRLPGESAGADRECERAAEKGVPVFYSVEEITAAFFGCGAGCMAAD